MSFKVTIALIVVAVISGVVFYFNPFVQDEEKKLPKPWFYQVNVDDMTSIGITFQGDSILFVKTSAGTWASQAPRPSSEQMRAPLPGPAPSHFGLICTDPNPQESLVYVPGPAIAADQVVVLGNE